jgi:Domain of unknown function (DUF1854)
MNDSIEAATPSRPSLHQRAEPRLSFERRQDGLFWARLGEKQSAVKLQRCFPWTEPDRYISLRAADDSEFAFVEDPTELDATSRALLEQALEEVGFVFRITRVMKVEEEFELRVWQVETPFGPRAFQTALDSWPRETPDGGLLIEDVAGDLFAITDPAALDPRSRELVWALVD